MTLSPRKRIILGIATANLCLLLVAGAVLVSRPAAPPLIQGVLLPQGKDLGDFALLDHRARTFTNRDLLGRWHLVSYGFTTCPDICPTTLARLSKLAARLDQDDSLRFLFYSVDHRRDTTARLASYVPYFHPDFVGLTHRDQSDNPHLPFEEGLGIVSRLVPSQDPQAGPEDYQVLHGVALFLLNPQGQLQAIFKPDDELRGGQDFDVDRLLQDYRAIRDYLGPQRNTSQAENLGML